MAEALPEEVWVIKKLRCGMAIYTIISAIADPIVIKMVWTWLRIVPCLSIFRHHYSAFIAIAMVEWATTMVVRNHCSV
jgi:hypothetical protein